MHHEFYLRVKINYVFKHQLMETANKFCSNSLRFYLQYYQHVNFFILYFSVFLDFCQFYRKQKFTNLFSFFFVLFFSIFFYRFLPILVYTNRWIFTFATHFFFICVGNRYFLFVTFFFTILIKNLPVLLFFVFFLFRSLCL